jgi:hypothetical protein
MKRPPFLSCLGQHYRVAAADPSTDEGPDPPNLPTGTRISSGLGRNLAGAASVAPYMSIGAFVIAMTIGAALLALWAGVRFPRMGPDTLAGALVQVAIALVAGWVLVPAAIASVISWDARFGPLIALLLFALPALTYLFLASIWAMRVLQEMMRNARR